MTVTHALCDLLCWSKSQTALKTRPPVGCRATVVTGCILWQSMTSWWMRFPNLANCVVAYTVTTLSSHDFWVLILTVRMYVQAWLLHCKPSSSWLYHTHSSVYCWPWWVLIFCLQKKINGTHTTVAQRLNWWTFQEGKSSWTNLPVNNTHCGSSVIKTGASFNGLFSEGWSLWTEIAREQNCMWIAP